MLKSGIVVKIIGVIGLLAKMLLGYLGMLLDYILLPIVRTVIYCRLFDFKEALHRLDQSHLTHFSRSWHGMKRPVCAQFQFLVGYLWFHLLPSMNLQVHWPQVVLRGMSQGCIHNVPFESI